MTDQAHIVRPFGGVGVHTAAGGRDYWRHQWTAALVAAFVRNELCHWAGKAYALDARFSPPLIG
jgi:hypothetical protein